MKSEISPTIVANEFLWRADKLITVTHANLLGPTLSFKPEKSYQLILLLNATGACRVVGNKAGNVDGSELILVSPEISCKWFRVRHDSADVKLISIKWRKELFESNILKAREYSFLKEMLSTSGKAFLFRRVSEKLIHRIGEMSEEKGIYSVTELLLVLYELAVSRDFERLSNSGLICSELSGVKNSRIVKACNFIDENFNKPISLMDVASVVHMSESGFSRYFKQKTGVNFIDVLSNTRVEYAAKLLTGSDKNISEISNLSGFCNPSNFIRVFKKIKKCTPGEYREFSKSSH